MKIIGYIIQKEFKQIFRNKGMLPIIFVLPLLQLIILSNAATFEVKNIKFAYIDHDHTSTSRALVEKFSASTYFDVLTHFPSEGLASSAMLRGEVDVVLEIPRYFERDLQNEKHHTLGVTINAIDGAAAGVENVYVNQIIQGFNQHLKVDLLQPSDQVIQPLSIDTIPLFWYNETLNYKTFMVPGILVLLVTMITLFLSGMNIVREKEIGTLEQINVTPIKKSQFIIGKLFPFWVIGMALLTIGLIIAKLIFNVPMIGSLPLMYFYTSIYILVVLGIGLFISNFTDTQQQAMFIAWFFTVIFILMSGLFTPIESMPQWAQIVTEFNPIKYFVEVMRMVMLKGSGFMDILPQVLKTLLYALVMNGLAVWSYKKTT
ncbi:ABC transporter permease [Subsaximicrobium wynnwilliamsii]|uniref:ABC transporter permease n=1 Tax=Subsaximicrobium wynnwilliamsii TaxID=291179 RepID=A0A5C6ZN52_9FLAO|nr:ABC transporter permease [Subsaximicrobium wynnwilliamsii]TXD84429.1 ABC transporter permease [Subsaximicrobium wynnwilliamsii]TXD90110.1 ABC transporter permease [Subsaximicrobium wynnwilliamsii]TXE04162.1 ABC transporter permease [Subsaximicrobium wynnwilliamsii]